MADSIFHQASTRGHANHGWLDARHSFSFASYYNPERVHFGALRVLNDDIVKGGGGFGEHPHDNMEIVTIPLVGALEHRDSMGNFGVIRRNDVQIMSAGSGLRHSEFNHDKEEQINLLQIWVFPKLQNIKPRYDQKTYLPEARKNRFLTVVSPEQSEETMWINQDAYFTLGAFDAGQTVDYAIKHKGNGVYIFLIEGRAKVGAQILERRDALGLWNTDAFTLIAESDVEVLVLDVPMGYGA